MEAIREKSSAILIRFIRYRTVPVEELVKFHNDLVDIYCENYHHEDYELIRDSSRACIRIGYLMTQHESVLRNRSLLFWALYILEKKVISVEFADDLIQAIFRKLLQEQNN